MRTGAEVTLCFSLAKAVRSASSQRQRESFRVRSNSGRACSEKSLMNRRKKLVNPRKDFTSFLFVGAGHLVTPTILTGSIETELWEMMTLRYSTVVFLNSHLSERR